MGLANYSELKQSVIAWSKRDDLDLLIDDFILIAEDAMLNNPQEILKLRAQETKVDLSTVISDRYLALPSNYISMRKMTVIDDTVRYPVNFRTPEQLNVKDFEGIPGEFTITSQIEFDKSPDQVYTVELQYIAGFTPLTSSNVTNIVLDNGPNVYLFGCLWAAFRWAQDLEEENRYLSLFLEAVTGSNKNTNQGQYGPRPVIIPRGTKP